MSANASAVGAALQALGSAYGTDWSCFDGRVLKAELTVLAAALKADAPHFDLPSWYLAEAICPVAKADESYCDERGLDWCVHLQAIASERKTT